MPSAERQIGSGQDYAFCGDMDGVKFAFVADGHGSSKCIDFLRSIDPYAIGTNPNPANYLFGIVGTIGDTSWSGFTFTFARVLKTTHGVSTIQVWNVGDSETHVFVNDVLKYNTPPHNFLNEAEIKRTEELVVWVDQAKAPFPVSADRIELVVSPQGHFHTGEILSLSMAYGHNNMTGFEPTFWEMDVLETDNLHIVCGSDGFFDMLVTDLCKTADELADEAAARWKQKWDYFDGDKIVKTTYGSNFDDVSVAVL